MEGVRWRPTHGVRKKGGYGLQLRPPGMDNRKGLVSGLPAVKEKEEGKGGEQRRFRGEKKRRATLGSEEPRCIRVSCGRRSRLPTLNQERKREGLGKKKKQLLRFKE